MGSNMVGDNSMDQSFTFSVNFPQGDMRRNGPPKPVPRDWIAVGVTSEPMSVRVPFDIPEGSMLSLTEVIPDTFAHVNPFQGTGFVRPFTNTYTLTVSPPASEEPNGH